MKTLLTQLRMSTFERGVGKAASSGVASAGRSPLLYFCLFKVGYGDKIPLTGTGRFVACLCALFGVLIFGLPIPVLVRSFHKFYNVVNVKNSNITVKNIKKPNPSDKMPSLTTSSTINNPKRVHSTSSSPRQNNLHIPRLTRTSKRSLPMPTTMSIEKDLELSKRRMERSLSC